MEFSTPFFIEKQESLATDKFSKNGRTLDLHIVAKNIAFVINVGAVFDLNQSPPSAKLIYDYDRVEDEKEVEALKSAPMEYTAHVDETGLKAAVEAKIAVLSSQHEGAFFRLKFSVVDPMSGAMIVEYSQPIKVISKRNQVKKMMERKLQKPLITPDAVIVKTPLATPVSPKRPATGDFEDVLYRLELQQREQTKMLQQLLTTNPQPIKQQITIPDPEDMDFETAFALFLKAYKKVPQQERAKKIRKVLKTAGETSIDNLTEFVGMYSLPHSNGITPAEEYFLNNLQMLDLPNCSDQSCKCQECPHKKQLSRLDDFYNDFLSDPLSPDSV